MKGEIGTEAMRTVMEGQGIDYMGVVEHWRGKGERIRSELGGEEEEELNSEGIIGPGYGWRERCRQRGKRGGVGGVAREEFGYVVMLEDWNTDAMLWQKIERGGSTLFIGVVYIVPEGSVYEEEGTQALAAMVGGLQRTKGEDVIILIDGNGRIGEKNVEVEGEEGRKVWERNSDDKMVNSRGIEILEILQSYRMVVLNGTMGEESGRATCRGKSVIDWIAASEGIVSRCRRLQVKPVWEEGSRVEGDHKLVLLEFDVKRFTKGERTEDGTVEVRKVDRSKVCVRRGWKDGWKKLVRMGDRTMQEWCSSAGTNLEESFKSWRSAYKRVVKVGAGRERVGKRTVKVFDQKIEEIKKRVRCLTREVMREGDVGATRKKLRAEQQRELRRHLRQVKREKMKGIEQEESKGGLIRRLKMRRSGQTRKVTGADRTKMKKGLEWIEGDPLRLEWKETFVRVGRDLKSKTGFDDDWKEEVQRKVGEWNETHGHGWGGREAEAVVVKGGRKWWVHLDGEISLEEVQGAVRSLKNGKSGGIDGVLAEIVKYGGEWMVKSIWMLCVMAWKEEGVPPEWLKAIKVPIKKRGKGDDFQHYRGVTLLSVVGKIYALVLEARIRGVVESKGALSDSQYGFRADRSTVDAVFVLTETAKRFGRAYIGFLDLAKAYPSVWWDGLWYKLRSMGVEGKMWRVVRGFYRKYEVAVRVQGTCTDWYEEEMGVREGCVLSPLLFAIYINDLVELIVKRCGTRVVIILFADDIAMIAQTPEDLQEALDAASEYSKKWRFEFNVGVDKSAVLVTGGVREGERWVLGGRELPVTTVYKYLGVQIQEKGWGGEQRKSIIVRTRRALWSAWGLGIGLEELSSKAAAKLWESLARPVLEHAGALEEGGWEEAELLQRKAGRMVLGVGRQVANEVVLGELGWWSVKGRMEAMRLEYWGRLVRMQAERGTKRAYEEGRRRVEEGVAGKDEWCVSTRDLLDRLGLGERWRDEKVGTRAEWKRKVRQIIGQAERRRWREGMVGKKPKIKLQSYRRIKKEMAKEQYLEGGRKEVGMMVNLRAGTLKLEVEQGRHQGQKPRWARVCEMCRSGEVEDAEHFLDDCQAWVQERKEIWGEVDKICMRDAWKMAGMDRRRRVEWIIKAAGGVEYASMRRKICGMIMRRGERGRNKREKKKRSAGGRGA